MSDFGFEVQDSFNFQFSRVHDSSSMLVPFSRRGIRLSNATTADFTVTVHSGASPDQFQRKLNLARRSLCRGDQTGAWDGIPGLIEDREVIRWRGKIGPVKEVEKLRAELNIDV